MYNFVKYFCKNLTKSQELFVIARANPKKEKLLEISSVSPDEISPRISGEKKSEKKSLNIC